MTMLQETNQKSYEALRNHIEDEISKCSQVSELLMIVESKAFEDLIDLTELTAKKPGLKTALRGFLLITARYIEALAQGKGVSGLQEDAMRALSLPTNKVEPRAMQDVKRVIRGLVSRRVALTETKPTVVGRAARVT